MGRPLGEVRRLWGFVMGSGFPGDGDEGSEVLGLGVSWGEDRVGWGRVGYQIRCRGG